MINDSCRAGSTSCRKKSLFGLLNDECRETAWDVSFVENYIKIGRWRLDFSEISNSKGKDRTSSKEDGFRLVRSWPVLCNIWAFKRNFSGSMPIRFEINSLNSKNRQPRRSGYQSLRLSSLTVSVIAREKRVVGLKDNPGFTGINSTSYWLSWLHDDWT